MICLRTSGAAQSPPYGSFDEYIVLEAREEKLLIRPEEFECLAEQLFINWRRRKSPYIQILQEWNENVGFNDVGEQHSIIKDVSDSRHAISLIEGVKHPQFGKLTSQDVKLIVDFFQKHVDVKIYKV